MLIVISPFLLIASIFLAWKIHLSDGDFNYYLLKRQTQLQFVATLHNNQKEAIPRSITFFEQRYPFIYRKLNTVSINDQDKYIASNLSNGAYRLEPSADNKEVLLTLNEGGAYKILRE
ncbi:hypothetical protein [Cohnella cholangitidis]|uniref:Uncharacterized protein n=1 Tax=Cohnella cholangitidis TaxID=2598458 RepID=A0A7G5BY07_9BACL|nr:hypothetical protein [Cohnella cholangitidis]QMV41841.1 hypothetical protein FPL14_12090 [Cohnella cholangitidis]